MADRQRRSCDCSHRMGALLVTLRKRGSTQRLRRKVDSLLEVGSVVLGSEASERSREATPWSFAAVGGWTFGVQA